MDQIGAYIASLTDLPANTRYTYSTSLAVFRAFMEPPDAPARAFERETLVAYKQHLAARRTKDGKTIQPRTIALYVGAARRFLRWLSLTGHMERMRYIDMSDYLEASSAQARVGYVARPIDPALDKLLHYYVDMPLPEAKPKRLILLRNRALVIFLYDTACRISEALSLTRADVADGRAETVLLRKTKGSKPRTIIVGEQARRYIREYVAEREDRSTAPLFLSHGRGKGNALKAHRAWQIVKDAAHAQGLMDSTSPHCLRHKKAQDLLDAGMPLEWISMLLGHKSPGTTKEIYAPWVNVGQLSDMVKKYGKDPLDA